MARIRSRRQWVGDGLDEFRFEEAVGLQLGVELGAGALVGGEVVRRQNHGLARETVAQGIERCATFPFRGDWPGGVDGVAAVDLCLIVVGLLIGCLTVGSAMERGRRG